MSLMSNPEMNDTIDMDDPHPNFICPISQDLMIDPVDIYHCGNTYTFEKNCVKTWWMTEGGDKNPLTMVEGFRGLEMKTNHQLADRIREFKIKTGQNPDEVQEELELLPFSDYQQIQDDEQTAIRLDRELNDSPSETRPSTDNITSNFINHIFRNLTLSNPSSTSNSDLIELVNGRLDPLASDIRVSINNRRDIENVISNNSNSNINIIRS